MSRWITRQRDSMRITHLGFCLRVIVNEKPINLEKTKSSVLSVLFLIYDFESHLYLLRVFLDKKNCRILSVFTHTYLFLYLRIYSHSDRLFFTEKYTAYCSNIFPPKPIIRKSTNNTNLNMDNSFQTTRI